MMAAAVAVHFHESVVAAGDHAAWPAVRAAMARSRVAAPALSSQGRASAPFKFFGAGLTSLTAQAIDRASPSTVSFPSQRATSSSTALVGASERTTEAHSEWSS